LGIYVNGLGVFAVGEKAQELIFTLLKCFELAEILFF